MRKPNCLSLVVVVIAFLLPIGRSWAWGNTGHEAVAAVAWSHLDQTTKDKVFALLQQVPSIQNDDKTITIPGYTEWSANLPAGLSEDGQHMYIFMRAATWPDSIKHHFFHDSDTPPANLTEAEANIGFTDRNSHGYWHFIDTPVGNPQTGSAAPALPNSCQRFGTPTPVTTLPDAPIASIVAEISIMSTALASDEDSALKAYDLVWLEHMVGDIHQPLHATVRFVGGIGDTGGNCVAISVPKPVSAHFVAPGSKERPPSELHAFWDDLPGTGSQMDTKPAADFAAALPSVSDDEAAITDPTIWAQESFAMAGSDVYATPIGSGFGTPKAYVITPAYYAKAYADAQQRIALAGTRLANLLTLALNGSSTPSS